MVIYLKTTPECIFERIKLRERPGENKINLEYLQHLHDLHENWLNKKKNVCPYPIVILDVNLNEHEIQIEYEKIKKIIERQ